MSKYRYLLNLQLFAEESDGFDETPAPEPDEIEMDPEDFGTEEEDTTPQPEPEQPAEPEQPQKIKLKFNHEEREMTLEEAATLAQKGLAFDKSLERARQEAAQQARDAYIAEQGYEWQGKPITTEAQYKQALAEQEIVNKYKDRDMPEEVIQELLEGRRDREERAKEKAAREEQQKKDAQVDEFLDYFQRVNERAFSPNDAIPQEVKDAVDRGETLKNAYMEYHNRELMNQLRIAKQNEANKQKAPVGSVTAFGTTSTESDDDFLAGFNSIN